MTPHRHQFDPAATGALQGLRVLDLSATVPLLPADHVVATSNAWLSPLPPEGASVIVHGDVDHAAEMAASQGIGAAALLEAGIVHRVVPEEPEDGPESLAEAVAARVAQELVGLRKDG